MKWCNKCTCTMQSSELRDFGYFKFTIFATAVQNKRTHPIKMPEIRKNASEDGVLNVLCQLGDHQVMLCKRISLHVLWRKNHAFLLM